MNLFIDVGNTNISIRLFKNKRTYSQYTICTSLKNTSPKAFKRLMGKSLGNVKEVFMVSVVPNLSTEIQKALKTISPHLKIFLIGRHIKVPMRIKYKPPRDVGQDRLVVSYAASIIYGVPVLTIDFGTAVTFDFVNAKGEYEGGLIFPGLRLSLESLFQKTALLPMIELKFTKGLIGKSTRSSMNNGLVYGYASMCDGIIERFKKLYGRNLKVVATGGDAKLVARYSSHIKHIKSDLIFTGLSFLKGRF